MPVAVSQTQASNVALLHPGDDASSVDSIDDDNDAFQMYLDNHALQYDVENTPAAIFGLKSVPQDLDALSHDGFNRHEGNLMEVPYLFDTPPHKVSKIDELMNESDLPTPMRLWSGIAQPAKGSSEAADDSISLQMPTYCKKP